MAKKKYRIYKAGGAQQGRVMNPTAKFLAKAQMGMQQPSPEEMQMMEQQAMQQQGQPQMSEEEMMMQQEQQMQMIMQLIEEYAELTQANPEEIFQVFQEAQDPQKQQAMLQQMAEVVEKANAGAADEVEAADQPMSKGGYVKNRVRQLKKAQEGMETSEELEETPTINDVPDGRESLVSNFNQSLKNTAQDAAFKEQAQQEFDSENYQFGGGKQRRQERRTNRRLRRAFKDIPMAYGINQMGVPSSGINVFAPAMMQMPSEKEIIKSENAENSEVASETNPQGINIKGNMKYGLFGRPKKYEFEMSGLPGAFTPFMGGMFGAGAMSTGSSGYYRSGTDWQDPVKAYVKFNNEANIVTNADEEQEMRDDPSQPSSDAEVKEKLEAEKRTVLSNFTDPYTTADGETIMTNPNAANYVSNEGAPELVPYTHEDGTTVMINPNAPNKVSMEDGTFESLPLRQQIELAAEQAQDRGDDSLQLTSTFTGEEPTLNQPDVINPESAEEAQELINQVEDLSEAEAEVAEPNYDDMSFSKAFATANKELGEDGKFTWRGKEYGTRRDSNWKSSSESETRRAADEFVQEWNEDGSAVNFKWNTQENQKKAEENLQEWKKNEENLDFTYNAMHTATNSELAELATMKDERRSYMYDSYADMIDKISRNDLMHAFEYDYEPYDEFGWMPITSKADVGKMLYMVEKYNNASAAEKAELEKKFKRAKELPSKNKAKAKAETDTARKKAYTVDAAKKYFTDKYPDYKQNSRKYKITKVGEGIYSLDGVDGGSFMRYEPKYNKYKTGGQVKKLKRYQEGGQPMLSFGDVNPADYLSGVIGSTFDKIGGVFKDLNSEADPEWSMTSPEQLEEQKKINEYQTEYEASNIPDEEFDQDSDWFDEQMNPDEIDSAMVNLKSEIEQFSLDNPEFNNDTSAIVDSLGILDDQSVAPIVMQALDSSRLAKLYHHASEYGTADLEDTLFNIYNKLEVSQETTDTLEYVAKLKAEAKGKITAEDLSGIMDWKDYLLIFGLPTAGVAYGVYKYRNRLPKNVRLSDFSFKPQKALPGGKATVTPMFKRKALPPGSKGTYSKSGKNIVSRFTAPRSAPKVVSSVAKTKPSYWSKFLKGAKGLAKGLGRNTPMLAPVWGLLDTEEDHKDDVFYQLYKPQTSIPSQVHHFQGGGSVNIDDPMYGNPDLYKFTGGGQDFMGYGGIPMAQFGYANVDEDLTDEERMSFSKTPEFAESARSMLDEDLYGGRGMGYDDMQYAASENLGYNEDKGDQVADYYDNILTDQGPAAFQNAINEGQDSYVSAIPFANNTNPFPAEIISNPQMEALQNYTAPEDLREQGYLNNNLEAQQQYLAPGEQYSDVQWDDDYQYGGYLMRAQDGASGIQNPDGPMPGFTWEQWEELSQEEQKQAIQGTRDARNQYATQRQQVQQPVNQRGFNPFGALAGALTGMPYGMGSSRQKMFNNTGGHWRQTGFPAGTIDPSNITRVHTEGKRGLFGPKGKMDIYFGGSGEAAADGVPQGSADGQKRGFPDMSYDARAERAEGRFDSRAQNAVDRRERRDARPGERAARQEGRQLNREERQFERNRRQNIRQGRGDTGGFDRDAAIARRATAAEQAANSQQVVADPNPGYTTDKLNDFKAGDMSRGQLRKADFNKSERKQYRQGDVEGASEARKNRRRAARKQYGGYYAEGGEYDLTTEEILEIMQACGQIEFI